MLVELGFGQAAAVKTVAHPSVNTDCMMQLHALAIALARCRARRFITLKVCLRTLNVVGEQTFLNDQESLHEPAIGEFRPSM